MDDSRAATPASLPPAPAAPAARWRSPWLVPGVLLLILTVLTVNVLANGPLVALDRRIRAAVQARAGSPAWSWVGNGGHGLGRLLTQLGNNQVAVPLLVLCAVVVAARHRSMRPLVAAAIGVVLLLTTVLPAKILIGRAGPGLPPVVPGQLGVFPSGHTATSSVCLGLGVLLLVPDLPVRVRWVAVTAMAVVCFLVGVALIWCDFHWFTDVVAGWALAALIVMGTLRLTGLGGNSRGAANAVGGGVAAVTREQADDSART
jgi:membrane-associated phospholipid phosphatase